MPSKHDASKAPQPALVPLHGMQDKKPRYLDRDSVILGRAKGCDIGLDAPDVSNLHCVVSRTPEGYRIRDCGSRSGTKINGENVKSATLQDGDVLQLGSFCFTVQIPHAPLAATVNPRQFKHLQDSRRHLARQGLRLRNKLLKLMDVGLSRTPTELTRKAANLKSQIRTYDERFSELELAERELVQERDKIGKEREAHQKHVEEIERDLGLRLGEADEQIRKRWQEFQKRCQQEESRAAQGMRPQPAMEANLQDQKEELDAFAAQLQEEQTRLDGTQRQLDEEMAVLRKQRQEIRTMQEQLSGQKGQLQADQDRLQSSLAHVEASLDEQRKSLARMMADMEKIQQALLAAPGPAGINGQHEPAGNDVILLAEHEENVRLRTRIEELEHQLTVGHADNKELNELCGDHDLLRQLLRDENSAGGKHPEADKLQADNECLAQLLKAKEEEIETLRKEAKPVTRGTLRESDLENYEAELNQYRRQLDTERDKLNTEIEQLRERNAELDGTVRDMEMEMSRERAELARERTRLDRMRDEVRLEMERMQREGPVRESLVGVQKLREEMANKGKPPAAGNALNDRLKGFRKGLTE